MRDSSRTPAGYVGGLRQAWVANYTGVFDDEPTGIAVDGSLNVYVTGYSSIPDYSAYVTIKYNAYGHEDWVASYSVPGSINSAAAIAVDSSGNVYVTGSSGNFGSGDYDYATIKYNNSGQQQWVARYNGPGDADDHAVAIAVDTLGSVYVTGYSPGSGTGTDYATIK
jgi:Beta-propeller repeat